MNKIIKKVEYREFLEQVLSEIQKARIKASVQLIRTKTELYFNIGKIIVDKQQKYGWGKSIVEQLAKDLKEITDATISFSERNLWFMKQFFTEYIDYPNLHSLILEVPWGQNILILQKIKDYKSREYYLKSKAGEYKAEYAGKLNLYLNLLDQQVRMEGENPPIGIILCAEKDNFEVEFSLKDFDKPIGIAEYQLTRKLPDKFKGKLPSANEIKKMITEKYGFDFTNNTEE